MSCLRQNSEALVQVAFALCRWLKLGLGVVGLGRSRQLAGLPRTRSKVLIP